MVTKRQIGSVESPESPHPWYELEVRNDAPYIVADKDGGTAFDMSDTAHKAPSFVDLPDPAQRAMSKDVVYAVTESGEFIAYEPGDDLASQGISLRAHLAFYDSEADEFTVLEFTER